MSSYPDFMCVGAQKAATTWLYDVLSRVPGVFLPRIKELHYFSELYSTDAKRFGPKHRSEQIGHIRRYHRSRNTGSAYEKMVLEQLKHIDTNHTSDDWYRGIFSFAQDHEICGEICPCYMAMPVRGVRHALSINPLMRILIIVRDPIDRLWSHMRMHVKSGYMDLDIQRVIEGNFEMGPYLRYTDYASAIPRWEHLSAPGRVKVMLYDQIGEDSSKALDEILAFIGVPGAQSRADQSKSVFSGQPINLPRELRAMLLDRLMPQYEFLHQRFPAEVDRWLSTHRSAIDTETKSLQGSAEPAQISG